jgi:hypothetical protein
MYKYQIICLLAFKKGLKEKLGSIYSPSCQCDQLFSRQSDQSCHKIRPLIKKNWPLLLLLLFIKPPTAGHHQLKGLKTFLGRFFLYTNYNIRRQKH